MYVGHILSFFNSQNSPNYGFQIIVVVSVWNIYSQKQCLLMGKGGGGNTFSNGYEFNFFFFTFKQSFVLLICWCLILLYPFLFPQNE